MRVLMVMLLRTVYRYGCMERSLIFCAWLFVCVYVPSRWFWGVGDAFPWVSICEDGRLRRGERRGW